MDGPGTSGLTEQIDVFDVSCLLDEFALRPELHRARSALQNCPPTIVRIALKSLAACRDHTWMPLPRCPGAASSVRVLAFFHLFLLNEIRPEANASAFARTRCPHMIS